MAPDRSPRVADLGLMEVIQVYERLEELFNEDAEARAAVILAGLGFTGKALPWPYRQAAAPRGKCAALAVSGAIASFGIFFWCPAGAIALVAFMALAALSCLHRCLYYQEDQRVRREELHRLLHSLPLLLEFEPFLLLLDMLSDLYAAWAYMRGGHHWFAMVVLTTWLLTFFTSYEKMWSLTEAMKNSLQQGYYNDDFLHLQDQESAAEGVVSLLLNVYALPWAVVSWPSLCIQMFNIALSLRSVSKLVIRRKIGIY